MVLCNFNKIDKFDSDSFAVWSQVMSRFPASVFRLVLDTRREVVRTIRTEFALRGVTAARVGFLSKVSKEEHIRRHLQMDLFLDSLVYGAHSTATDALLGGLPVLTVAGDTFPQRVGSSLLASLSGAEGEEGREEEGRRSTNHEQGKVNSTDSPPHVRNHSRRDREGFKLLSQLLNTFSKKSFEDVAVRMLRSPRALHKLRRLLLQASGSLAEGEGVRDRPVQGSPRVKLTERDIIRSKGDTGGGAPKKKTGFFHTEAMVADFLRGMQAASEMQRLRAATASRGTGSASPGSGDASSLRRELKYPHIIVTNQ
jgi:hypothetical protein